MNLKEEKDREWEEKILNKWEDVDSYDENALYNLNRLHHQLVGKIIEKYATKSLDLIEPHSLPSTRNIILNIYKNTANKVILDSGCGPNPIISIYLAQRSNRVISIDISKGIINTARMFAKRDRIQNIDFVLADLQHLPFKKNVFEIVICSDTIEHIPRPEVAIDELSRSINKNGEILFTIPNRWSFVILLSKFKDVLRGKKKQDRKYYISPSHLKEYTYPEVNKLLKNKLSVREHYPLGWEGGWKASTINETIRFKPLRRFSSHIVIKCQKIENL